MPRLFDRRAEGFFSSAHPLVHALFLDFTHTLRHN
jgi:hypothetical protein